MTSPSNSSARSLGDKPKRAYGYEGLDGWRGIRWLCIGRGMYHDVRRRLPYYWSDITDALTYRTIASTVRMYFVKYVTFLTITIGSVRLRRAWNTHFPTPASSQPSLIPSIWTVAQEGSSALTKHCSHPRSLLSFSVFSERSL